MAYNDDNGEIDIICGLMVALLTNSLYLSVLVVGLIILVAIEPTASTFKWQVKYEADKLAKESDPPWERSGPDNYVQLTPKGILHVNDISDVGGNLALISRKHDPKDLAAATIEARVKAVSNSDGWAVHLGIEDTAWSAVLHVFPDHIQLASVPNTEVKIDMTDFHILRIVKNKTEVLVFVDTIATGQEVLKVKAWARACPQCNRFLFGAGSSAGKGESFWDYVRYTTAGAFSELDEETASVNPHGKLTVIWGNIKGQ